MKKAIIFDIGSVVVEFHFADLYKIFADKTITDLETLWIAEGLKIAEINDELVKWILSCVEHLKKPDPAFYDLALKKAETEAKDAVFIDDNPEYVDAARQVGFKDVLFTDNESLFAILNNL